MSGKTVTIDSFYDTRYWLWQSEGIAWMELINRVNEWLAGYAITFQQEDENGDIVTSEPQYQDLSWNEQVDEYVASHPQDLWLQTSGLRHSKSYADGSSRSHLNDDAENIGGILSDVKADSRYPTVEADRVIFGLHPSSATGGSGGLEALDPDLRVGAVWDPLDTTKIKFDLYDVAIKGFLPARRPGRGGYIQGHPERISTIRVLNSNGEPIFATTDFALETIHRPKKERLSSQVTFDQVFARFGAERMRVYNFAGKLLDSENFDWMRQWDDVWERFLRGEVLARNLWRAYVLSKGKLYGGYMVSTSIQESVKGPGIPFTFTMLMTDEISLPGLVLVTKADKYGLEQNYYRFKGDKEEFDTAVAKNNLLLGGGTNEALPGEKTTYFGDDEK